MLFARQRWGAAIEFVVVSKFDIVVAMQTAFADALSHRAVFELAELDPGDVGADGVHAAARSSFGYRAAERGARRASRSRRSRR